MPDFMDRVHSFARRRGGARGVGGAYREALGAPGALAFFLGAAPGRIGISMTSLGIVWLVHWRTGSFGAAGIVTGGFAIAEGSMGPQVARLIDRFGQTRVVPPCLIAHGLAVAALVGVVVAGAPLWVITAVGVLAGASIPQIGALTTARWAWLLHGTPALSTAFALESMSNGVSYLVGPVLVGTVCVFVHPASGSLLAAALILAGGAALILRRDSAPPPGPGSRPGIDRRTATLLRPGFAVLVGVSIALGLFFGSMQVSVTAFALGHGEAAAAGPLNGVMSLTSLLAGLVYGLRYWRTSPSKQLAITFLLLTVSALPLLFVDTTGSLGLVLAGSGLLIAPTLTLLTILTQAHVDRAVLTQAFTWLNSSSVAGVALAAAAAGYAADTLGTRWGFGIAVAATAAATATVWIGRRTLNQQRTAVAPLTPDAQH